MLWVFVIAEIPQPILGADFLACWWICDTANSLIPPCSCKFKVLSAPTFHPQASHISTMTTVAHAPSYWLNSQQSHRHPSMTGKSSIP